MKFNVILIGALVSIVVQAQVPQAPKPGPEHKKLGVFLGTWAVEGELKVGNGYGAPAGKVSQVERFQWMPGEFFLQMNREGKGPAGDSFRHSIMFGYDPVGKKYTGTWYDFTTGGSMSATLTNNGNTWTWSGSGHTGDAKRFQERCTGTVASNGASMAWKCETSADGKNWSPSWESKSTKSKS